MSKSSGREALDKLNAERAVIQIKGKVRIAGWEQLEDRPGKSLVLSTPAEMRTLYANQFVDITTDDGVQRKPLFSFWLQQAGRPTAVGVTMAPDEGRFVGEQLNLWQGYGVEPEFLKPWPLLRRHIVEVICSGNEAHADYLLRWIAWALQNPTKQSEVVVVLRGRKGTGKGMLGRILCTLFGAHSMQISDRKHLVGSFNAHLMQVCFLFADEAFWPGDKGAEGQLKRMITEDTLLIEPKGVDGFEVPNRLTILMASNESWVVPATSDERRFVVFDVSDCRRRDSDYFKALTEALDGGGELAGFLDEMLDLDLKGWHPRQDMPATQGLADQQAESASPMLNWLGTILEEGALPYSTRDATGQTVRVVHRSDPALARPGLLWEVARKRDRRLQHESDVTFWKFLDEHGITRADEKRTGAGRYRRFPPLPEARAAFADKYSFWPEFSDPGTHWRFDDDGRSSYGDWEHGEDEL